MHTVLLYINSDWLIILHKIIWLADYICRMSIMNHLITNVILVWSAKQISDQVTWSWPIVILTACLPGSQLAGHTKILEYRNVNMRHWTFKVNSPVTFTVLVCITKAKNQTVNLVHTTADLYIIDGRMSYNTFIADDKKSPAMMLF